MPVVLRIKGFKFWFYEADLDERPHVHAGKAGAEAKFWLSPILLARSKGFRNHEQSEIENIIREHTEELLMAWQREQEKRANR